MKQTLTVTMLLATLLQGGCTAFCDREVRTDPFAPDSPPVIKWHPKWQRTATEAPEISAMRWKLEHTVIPVIDFHETPVVEAVAFLEEQSRNHDPGLEPKPGRGVSLVIKASSPPEVAALTFHLENVSLLSALKICVKYTGWRFRFEDGQVQFVDAKR